jgi:GPH family glycoside/pentoside/hexuronide:cation symporter
MSERAATSPAPAAPVAPASLPLGTRVAYGASAFGENLAINSINQLANAVFNITLGVPLLLVGLALSLPRLIDVFLDPFVGNWSDRLRSRWGRRRPFIFVGALMCAVVATGLWYFPEGQSKMFYFWWLLGGCALMSVAYSVLIVPYGALGLELVSSYHERTKLMGTKSILHKASGVVNQWLLKWVREAGGGNLIAGGRICAPVIGAAIAILGFITVWKVREPERPVVRVPAARQSLWSSWRITMGQPDFRRLVLAQIFIYMSFLVIDTTGFYLNVFYVHGGDMGVGAGMKGWYGMAFQLCGMAAVPLIVKLSRRIGKKQAFLVCTITIALGGFAKWFCYVPGAGWWIVLPSALMGPGLVAVMVLVPSMTADICDLDAAESGSRREGMFNSVLAWALKLALTGSILLANIVLHLVGWKTELQAAQSEATYLAMRIGFAGGTIVLALLGAWCIYRYSVTPDAVAAAQARAAQRLRD